MSQDVLDKMRLRAWYYLERTGYPAIPGVVESGKDAWEEYLKDNLMEASAIVRDILRPMYQERIARLETALALAEDDAEREKLASMLRWMTRRVEAFAVSPPSWIVL